MLVCYIKKEFLLDYFFFFELLFVVLSLYKVQAKILTSSSILRRRDSIFSNLESISLSNLRSSSEQSKATAVSVEDDVQDDEELSSHDGGG